MVNIIGKNRTKFSKAFRLKYPQFRFQCSKFRNLLFVALSMDRLIIVSKTYLHHFFQPQVFPRAVDICKKFFAKQKKIFRKSMDSVPHMKFEFLMLNHVKHSMFLLLNFSHVALTQNKSSNIKISWNFSHKVWLLYSSARRRYFV